MEIKRGFAVCAAILAALAAAQTAAAHAVLVGTDPGNDSILEESPGRVSLRFSEPVETAFGSVRVYDSNARRADAGNVSQPEERSVAVEIDKRLARGTYTVTWRVISADAHPVSGAFVFHVEAPGVRPEGVAAEVLREGTPGSVTVAYTAARFLDFSLVLLVAGGTASLVVVLGSAAASLRSRLFRVIAVLAAALVAVALAGIVLQGAAAGGFGVRDALSWDVVSAVLETRFGKVALVQAALAAGVVALVLVPRVRLAALAPAAALVTTPAAAGHASVSGALAFASDIAHVAAAAAWAGGLAFLGLGLVLAREERWPLAARAVPRFSTLALAAVAVLLTAGVVNGYEQVQAWRGLWETTYGLLLLAKVALVLPLLALGAYNNRFAVPSLRRGTASLAERRRFLRAAGAELVLMVGIVAVTAVLVAEPPARATVAPRGPYATTAQLGDLELNLVADPAQAGRNDLHLYLTNRSGQPTDVAELRMLASLPSKRVGPLRFRTERLASGHFSALGVQLAISGDWQIRVEARRGEFESLTQTISIPIRKDS
jgi:copper transport protein